MRQGQRRQAVSRHHILPPIVYAPAPPKPKETRRRRGVGQLKGTSATEETEETGEATDAAPTRSTAALPQHSTPVEATERGMHSTTGNLSEGTLKAMLEVQEQEGAQAAGGLAPPAKE
jgi:hypothetical protein